ncbi:MULTISPECIES: L,D-transpeptidase family protein [Legionella]|nr:L,D-transpeptidase family protein [Legionella steelei]OJW08860.1 MAG: L,D-transpeptidase [Legionella sp. 39-23]
MKIKAVLLMISIFFPIALFAGTATCPLSNGINVHTTKHILNICKQGTVVKTFKVALGYKGVGKKKAGDNKTPIGLYGLAHPRKSNQFKVFIPILYPTTKQAAAGYTGRDVGIHGPTQSSGSGWLSWLSNLPYSTRGCIAVGKNNHIEYVAKWVKTHPGTKVLII